MALFLLLLSQVEVGLVLKAPQTRECVQVAEVRVLRHVFVVEQLAVAHHEDVEIKSWQSGLILQVLNHRLVSKLVYAGLVQVFFLPLLSRRVLGGFRFLAILGEQLNVVVQVGVLYAECVDVFDLEVDASAEQ